MKKRISGNYLRGLLFLAANLLVVFLLIVLVNPSYLPQLPFLNPSANTTVTRTEAVQAENPQANFSFLVFGDSGTGNAFQQKLAKVMLNYPFTFILHVGDLAYPSSTNDLLEKNFFQMYSSHLQRAKVYPAPGNHDYLADDLQPYLDKFNLPKQAFNVRDQEKYYSFDFGKAHFVSLDTNTPLFQISDERADDMADWLNYDLRNSSDQLWKIVYFHHAPYSSGTVHGGDQRVRDVLVPILQKYQVDLVFSGHEHNYERTCAMLDGKCGTDGIVYVVTGGGGGDLYQFGPIQPFSEARAVQYHFVYVSINDCQLKANAIGIDNSQLDSFLLNKCGR